MRRGELYRVRHPTGDPKRHRVFVVASRQTLIDSKHSTVICAPVHSQRLGLSTEVHVGVDQGLLHASAIRCDSLVSIPKSRLTDFVGSLTSDAIEDFDRALATALDIGT